MTVRGTEGVAAPITVFQQVVLEELGTVIAWEERGLPVGLYGRRFGADRVEELLGMAEEIEVVDGGFRLPASALPDGFEVVFTGGLEALALMRFTADYEVRYRTIPEPSDSPGEGGDMNIPRPGGLVTLWGFEASAAEHEAVRFLTLGLQETQLHGRPAIVGHPWLQEDGPALVTWREPDGLVVRILGLGPDLATVSALAESTRDLTGPDWSGLLEATGSC